MDTVSDELIYPVFSVWQWSCLTLRVKLIAGNRATGRQGILLRVNSRVITGSRDVIPGKVHCDFEFRWRVVIEIQHSGKSLPVIPDVRAVFLPIPERGIVSHPVLSRVETDVVILADGGSTQCLEPVGICFLQPGNFLVKFSVGNLFVDHFHVSGLVPDSIRKAG